MTRDPRPYNGLHLPNGAQAVSQGEQLKRAITMEMQALTREIYVRAAAEAMRGGGPDAGWPEDEQFMDLARTAKAAARAYFVGLGIIQLEETDDQSE